MMMMMMMMVWLATSVLTVLLLAAESVNGSIDATVHCLATGSSGQDLCAYREYYDASVLLTVPPSSVWRFIFVQGAADGANISQTFSQVAQQQQQDLSLLFQNTLQPEYSSSLETGFATEIVWEDDKNNYSCQAQILLDRRSAGLCNTCTICSVHTDESTAAADVVLSVSFDCTNLPNGVASLCEPLNSNGNNGLLFYPLFGDPPVATDAPTHSPTGTDIHPHIYPTDFPTFAPSSTVRCCWSLTRQYQSQPAQSTECIDSFHIF